MRCLSQPHGGYCPRCNWVTYYKEWQDRHISWPSHPTHKLCIGCGRGSLLAWSCTAYRCGGCGEGFAFLAPQSMPGLCIWLRSDRSNPPKLISPLTKHVSGSDWHLHSITSLERTWSKDVPQADPCAQMKAFDHAEPMLIAPLAIVMMLVTKGC
jgi:hypothetical protein